MKVLEDKAENHTESFSLFSPWTLGELVGLSVPSSVGPPVPGHGPADDEWVWNGLPQKSPVSIQLGLQNARRNCGGRRSLPDSQSVLGGAQCGWVGLGCRVPTVSGWRPDVLLRDVLQRVRGRLTAALPTLHRPSGRGPRCTPRGEEGLGHWTAAPGWVQRDEAAGQRRRRGGRRGVVRAAAHWRSVDRAWRRARSPSRGELGSGGRGGGGRSRAGAAAAAERGHLRREEDARGLKVGKEEAGRRAGALARGSRAREPGEVELGGGAG